MQAWSPEAKAFLQEDSDRASSPHSRETPLGAGEPPSPGRQAGLLGSRTPGQAMAQLHLHAHCSLLPRIMLGERQEAEGWGTRAGNQELSSLPRPQVQAEDISQRRAPEREMAGKGAFGLFLLFFG